MTAGRPKRSEAELLQDRAKVQAQIFGANNSVFQFEQEEIYLPPPPAKKSMGHGVFPGVRKIRP